jgi:hypothetical protein
MIFEKNKDPKKILELGRPFGFGKNLGGIEFNDGERKLYLRKDFAEKISEELRYTRGGRFQDRNKFQAKYGRDGMQIYACNIFLRVREIDGKIYYEVYGMSGDFGFNGGQRTKKEYLGKRRVKSILRQYYEYLEKEFYGGKDFSEKAS